jgi:hypothetical protein
LCCTFVTSNGVGLSFPEGRSIVGVEGDNNTCGLRLFDELKKPRKGVDFGKGWVRAACFAAARKNQAEQIEEAALAARRPCYSNQHKRRAGLAAESNAELRQKFLTEARENRWPVAAQSDGAALSR